MKTHPELADIAPYLDSLPAARVRWGGRRDLDAVAALERATLGHWTLADFLDELRRRHSIIVVAECVATLQIRGYAVYSVDPHDTDLTVLTMAAADPKARAAVLDKLAHKAAHHKRPLAFNPNQY